MQTPAQLRKTAQKARKKATEDRIKQEEADAKARLIKRRKYFDQHRANWLAYCERTLQYAAKHGQTAADCNRFDFRDEERDHAIALVSDLGTYFHELGFRTHIDSSRIPEDHEGPAINYLNLRLSFKDA